FAAVLSEDESNSCITFYLGHVRSRICRQTIRCIGVRQAWRHEGTQEHFPHHPDLNGWINIRDRSGTRLRHHWHCRSHHRTHIASGARPCVGRGVWWSSYVCSRARTSGETRIFHELYSDNGYARFVCFIGCHSHHAAFIVARRLWLLGMESSFSL